MTYSGARSLTGGLDVSATNCGIESGLYQPSERLAPLIPPPQPIAIMGNAVAKQRIATRRPNGNEWESADR